MNSALRYSVEGYIQDSIPTLDHVKQNLNDEFYTYSWHVVEGSPETFINKDVFIKVVFDHVDYTLNIFGKKKN